VRIGCSVHQFVVLLSFAIPLQVGVDGASNQFRYSEAGLLGECLEGLDLVRCQEEVCSLHANSIDIHTSGVHAPSELDKALLCGLLGFFLLPEVAARFDEFPQEVDDFSGFVSLRSFHVFWNVEVLDRADLWIRLNELLLGVG